MIIAFCISLYVLMAMALYGISIYKKGSNDEDVNLLMSIFWPSVLIFLIICSPFIGVRWFAYKLRENKKKKIDPWKL